MTDEAELSRRIRKLILAGKVDNSLDGIGETLLKRKMYLRDRQAKRFMEEVTIGTQVVVVGNVKPRYLIGKVGTVTRIDHSKGRYPLLVSFGRSLGKFQSGTIWMPPASLEIMGEAPEAVEGVVLA